MLADILINSKIQQPLLDLAEFLKITTCRVLLCAESNGRHEMLLEKLRALNIEPKSYPNWQSFLSDDKPLGIAVAALEQGLQLELAKIIVIVEAQLYGQRVLQGNLRKTSSQDRGSIIRNLTELQAGTTVVHIDHGIGLYQGLQTIQIQTGDLVSEYLMLEYADNNKLYVPVTDLHLITRYGGISAQQVTLSNLGTKQWQAQREKAAHRAYDVAAELLDLNARRQARPGFKFAPPNEHYFCRSFSI